MTLEVAKEKEEGERKTHKAKFETLNVILK